MVFTKLFLNWQHLHALFMLIFSKVTPFNILAVIKKRTEDIWQHSLGLIALFCVFRVIFV